MDGLRVGSSVKHLSTNFLQSMLMTWVSSSKFGRAPLAMRMRISGSDSECKKGIGALPEASSMTHMPTAQVSALMRSQFPFEMMSSGEENKGVPL